MCRISLSQLVHGKHLHSIICLLLLLNLVILSPGKSRGSMNLGQTGQQVCPERHPEPSRPIWLQGRGGGAAPEEGVPSQPLLPKRPQDMGVPMGREAQPRPQALQQGPCNTGHFPPHHRLVKGTETRAQPPGHEPKTGTLSGQYTHKHACGHGRQRKGNETQDGQTESVGSSIFIPLCTVQASCQHGECDQYLCSWQGLSG